MCNYFIGKRKLKVTNANQAIEKYNKSLRTSNSGLFNLNVALAVVKLQSNLCQFKHIGKTVFHCTHWLSHHTLLNKPNFYFPNHKRIVIKASHHPKPIFPSQSFMKNKSHIAYYIKAPYSEIRQQIHPNLKR